MTFNLFVLPFFLGLCFLFYYIGKRYYRWIKGLEPDDKDRFRKGFWSIKLFYALREIFFESLIHRKMFKKTPLLGYMHMSFAFGWFLLIIVGNMESRIYSGLWVNPPYYPIFLKFFIHDKRVLPFEIFTVPGFFRFSMDLILIFIILGLVLALLKRSHSKWFGLKKTTRHQLTDKVAMMSLWIIFPSRLLAESFTAGAYGYGGGFITQHLGNVLAFLWPLSDKGISYFIWWVYSLSLGIFFVMLPYTRYMHIPTELMLILFRHFGIKSKKEFSVFSEVELYSCSRCGICIDACQLNTSAGITNIQSTYFLQSVRDQQVREDLVHQCLVCGRCSQECPVGIDTDSQRIIQRQLFNGRSPLDFSYLPLVKTKKAEIAYFAGCMTRLTPGVIKSITGIFRLANVDYVHLDEDSSICCGRPLQLAGKEKQARAIIQSNRDLIGRSGARVLVTSCPICLKIFQQDYNLDIPVIHHSKLLLDLVKTGRVPLQSYFRKISYHDPCELGRGTGVYEDPRELLSKVADLVDVEKEKQNSLCCGGSLGLLNASQEQRDLITRDTLDVLLKNKPDLLITACPLCKKTLSGKTGTEVRDLAELIYDSIPEIHAQSGTR